MTSVVNYTLKTALGPLCCEGQCTEREKEFVNYRCVLSKCPPVSTVHCQAGRHGSRSRVTCQCQYFTLQVSIFCRPCCRVMEGIHHASIFSFRTNLVAVKGSPNVFAPASRFLRTRASFSIFSAPDIFHNAFPPLQYPECGSIPLPIPGACPDPQVSSQLLNRQVPAQSLLGAIRFFMRLVKNSDVRIAAASALEQGN